MKKLATKVTPTIIAWAKEEFDINLGDAAVRYFHLPKVNGWHSWHDLKDEYTEVSEAEFLAEFGKPKVEYQYFTGGKWQDIDMPVRIKPTPDYSPEIEALQQKTKENGMIVPINFKKIWNH